MFRSKLVLSLVLAFVGACASDPDGSEPWDPSAGATSSGGGSGGSGSTAPGATTMDPDEPPPSTSEVSTGVGCLVDEDCPPGSVCVDGTCQPAEPEGTTTGSTCSPATTPCDDDTTCCDGLLCDSTSLGQTCCGWEAAPCNTENGEDCCGNLSCIDGACGYEVANACSSPCSNSQPPALQREKLRLENIGGSFLGICGDANHTYGYHIPAALLPADDYSMQGAANDPVCEWHAAAIDISMDWPASRDWLMWLIQQIQTDAIQGIAEVIGSYDGVNVRYWSDSSGWSTEGVEYTGVGHDTWTHVAIYRSTTLDDHEILFGWTGDGLLP